MRIGHTGMPIIMILVQIYIQFIRLIVALVIQIFRFDERSLLGEQGISGHLASQLLVDRIGIGLILVLVVLVIVIILVAVLVGAAGVQLLSPVGASGGSGLGPRGKYAIPVEVASVIRDQAMVAGGGCLGGDDIPGGAGANGQAVLLMPQGGKDPLLPAHVVAVVVTQVVLLHGQVGIEGLLGSFRCCSDLGRLMIALQFGTQVLLVPQMMMALLMSLQLLRLLQLLQSQLLMGAAVTRSRSRCGHYGCSFRITRVGPT